jgi:hypothetical protein
MRKTIVVLAMLALVVPAMADVLTPEIVKGQVGGQSGTERGITVYDNTGSPIGIAFSQNPGAWIGDELLMTGGGILEDVGFSIYNKYHTGVGQLDFVDADILFFDANTFAYVGGVTFAAMDMFTMFGSALLPGYFGTVYADGLASLNINLPQNIIAIEVLYNPLGTNVQGLGQVGGQPAPLVGASTNDFYLDNTLATPPGTQAGWYWFGATNSANFWWEISVVPEPASFGLLALGALALIRRR